MSVNVNLDHAQRIAKLEANEKHTSDKLDRLSDEVSKVRRAIWMLCLVLAATGVDTAKVAEILKGFF